MESPESSSGRSGLFQTDISFSLLFFFVGVLGMHIYSVNSNAVQGYRLHSLENEIAAKEEENARLKIQEADAKSFQRIEAASASLELDLAVVSQYFEERDIVATR